MHISVDRFKVQLTKPCKEKSEDNSHSIFQRGHSKWSLDDQMAITPRVICRNWRQQQSGDKKNGVILQRIIILTN